LETWQTAPTTVIPFALRPSTAPSTFFCSAKKPLDQKKHPIENPGQEGRGQLGKAGPACGRRWRPRRPPGRGARRWRGRCPAWRPSRRPPSPPGAGTWPPSPCSLFAARSRVAAVSVCLVPMEGSACFRWETRRWKQGKQSGVARIWENSLFDTGLKCGSLFDTEQLFLPYMTLCLKFVPYMTFRPILPLTVLKNTWKDVVAPRALSDKIYSWPIRTVLTFRKRPSVYSVQHTDQVS
jgi:hypothetical protein